jgi:nucleotidyltransferase substrate binding protein (TIGR01987 family)
MAAAGGNEGAGGGRSSLVRPHPVALAESSGDRRNRDSVILDFLLTYETAWEALKQALAADGLHATSPKKVLRLAFGAGRLTAEEPWLAMVEDRNLIAQT